MNATLMPQIDQIISAGTDLKRELFLRLAKEYLQNGGTERPIPFTDEKGKCYGVYWPVFVSTQIKPPEIPAIERAELLRRCETLDNSADFRELLK